MDNVDIPELMTTEEVAETFKVSERTIRRWANQGILKGKKIGGILRFSKDEVVRVINKNGNEN